MTHHNDKSRIARQKILRMLKIMAEHGIFQDDVLKHVDVRINFTQGFEMGLHTLLEAGSAFFTRRELSRKSLLVGVQQDIRVLLYLFGNERALGKKGGTVWRCTYDPILLGCSRTWRPGYFVFFFC